MYELSSPKAKAGFEIEDEMVKYFSDYIENNGLDWIVIHSVVGETKDPLPHVVLWNETAMKNAQLGDFRIARCDIHCRPQREYMVYVDVKYSENYGYASVSFPNRYDDPKRDAIEHLCNFIGRGVKDDFWYMSCGCKGIIMISLTEVQRFVRNAPPEVMREVCKPGKYNGRPSWFMSLEPVVNRFFTYDRATWIDEYLGRRIG